MIFTNLIGYVSKTLNIILFAHLSKATMNFMVNSNFLIQRKLLDYILLHADLVFFKHIRYDFIIYTMSNMEYILSNEKGSDSDKEIHISTKWGGLDS